ncbi:MAG TPA: hypothetical protein VJU78_13335, partial [Chitinophagaceae bacterium]|nr:hypothetical protein [Chitinophagaceae bacterium]
MFKIITSLSFLYVFTIALLLLYGVVYNRNFKRSCYNRRLFPSIFLIISIACYSFLWINIHAPLKLKTFSNLDHYFIQHDGFEVIKKIELGRSDTINSIESSFNRFVFTKQNGTVSVNATYSEDPLYINGENGYRILSVNYPAIGHFVSFQIDDINITISATENDWFELKAGEKIFKKQFPVKKGVSSWGIFRDEDELINSAYYNNEKLVACLKNILFLRDDVSRKKAGELKYFLAGRLFSYAGKVKYDEQNLKLDNQRFNADLPDQSTIAWGIGFLENNRNQYKLKYAGTDSFLMISRYPVAYPLSEENRNDWNSHRVSKFLLA